jgi:hypothetical protein
MIVLLQNGIPIGVCREDKLAAALEWQRQQPNRLLVTVDILT